MSSSTTVPVGQPLHGASFGQAVARFFRGYVQFSGRASRSEFWWAMLFTTLVSLAVQIPFWIVWAVFMTRVVEDAAATGSAPGALPEDLMGLLAGMVLAVVVLLLVSLALTLPAIAVMWRRLQDANFHGAFALLSLVSLGIVPLILCFFDSNPAGIRFDPAFAGQGLAAYGQPQQLPNPVASAYGESAHPFAQPPYGAQPYGQQPYGAQPYGQQSYDEQPQQPYGQPYGPPYDQPYGQPAEQPTGDRPYSQGYPQS